MNPAILPAQRRRIPTASATVGPFFPPQYFGLHDHDLTCIDDPAQRARGQKIRISGRVFEANRVPRWNCIIELWQADAGGRFAHPNDPRHAEADPNFMGWGRRWTDNQGNWEFASVKPGGYDDPLTGARRAPHINLSLTGSGLMRRLVTTLFFEGEPSNAADPVFSAIPDPKLRERLLLRPAGEGEYRIDIVLQGEDETPFFAD